MSSSCQESGRARIRFLERIRNSGTGGGRSTGASIARTVKELHRFAELDSEKFDVRRRAANELRRLGECAESRLRAALKDQLPLEARKRIEELQEGIRT